MEGEPKVSQQKMGTHYVREICQTFREVAEKSSFPDIKEKLISLADEMEPIAGKLYFKTQKGTEEMVEMAGELGGIVDKLSGAADASAAQDICGPYITKIEKSVKAAKTMKVRMT
jgi:hypothetical protein